MIEGSIMSCIEWNEILNSLQGPRDFWRLPTLPPPPFPTNGEWLVESRTNKPERKVSHMKIDRLAIKRNSLIHAQSAVEGFQTKTKKAEAWNDNVIWFDFDASLIEYKSEQQISDT